MTRNVIQEIQILEGLPILFNFKFSEDEFFEFCQLNQNLFMERDADGTIHIMPPTGFEAGNFNGEVFTEVSIWNRKAKLGRIVDSSTGYTLPNGAVRSPDVSWISHERLATVSKASLEKFPRVCPDFVVEITSPNDKLKKTKAKMEEYMANGCRLAWLIHKKEEEVIIYRENGSISLVESFDEVLSGEEVLRGFELKLSTITDTP